MNCAFDKEKLTGYYDGELDAAEKAEVERHIASCSECLRELGELKSAAILVKELPRLRAPRSIAEGVSKEIQAAGKVHSFAKFRRTLLWSAAAAAGLLVVLNVVYFAGKTSDPGPAVATGAPSAAPVVGRAQPAEDPGALRRESASARESAKDAEAARPVQEREQMERGRKAEARKNTLGAADEKKVAESQAGKRAEPAPMPEAAGRDKDRALTGAPAKAEEKARSAAPTAEPAKPAAPPAPAAPAPTVKARPAEAPADKAPQKKEFDGLAGAKLDEMKAKKIAGAPPAADAGPTHLTLASTQMTKSRSQVEESLRRMGALPPLPPGGMPKGGTRATREESVYLVELTDAQVARLRAELEKPGTAVLVTGRPEDPVMAQFRRGGMFEAKKESAVASGGAGAAKKPADSRQPDSKQESKDAEDAPAAKAFAEGAAEKPAEPRRKFVLHLMEVPSLPVQPAGDRVKK